MKTAWYKKSYRRNLIDMHIADWDEGFMSQFDPVTYVDMLTLSDVDTAIIYAGSCLGICYWPTKIGHMHLGLKGRDIIEELINECQDRGLNVVIYFNIWSRWAYDTYPDWRMVDSQGRTLVEQGGRYGICCPNSPYHEYVQAQITDLSTSYDFEGLWIDMIGWFGTVCYCKYCEQRYMQEVGKHLPQTVDWGHKDWVTFQRRREVWLAEFATMITNTAKEIKPAASVVHQVTSGFHGWGGGGSHVFYEQSDYLAGDFNHDPEKQSFVCKFLHSLSKNKPIEFMTSRCLDLRYHTTMKSKALLEAQACSSLANNASFLFIDAVDPIGTLNRDTYEMMRDIFQKTKPYERYLDPDAQLCVDVGVYINFESLVNMDDNGKHISAVSSGIQSFRRLYTMTKTFINHNIAFGIVTEKDLSTLSRYQVLVLPEVVALSEEEMTAIRQYVKSGGSIYASRHTSLLTKYSGRNEDFLLIDVFGVTYSGETVEDQTYFTPTEDGAGLFAENSAQFPMWISSAQVVTRPVSDSAKILATMALPYTHPNDNHRFASAISNPPGIYTEIPAIVLHAYGNGQALYVSGDVENMEEEPQRDLFATLIRSLYTKKPKWITNAPKAVEVTVYDQESHKRWIINAINFQQELPNIPVYEMEIQVLTDGKTPGKLRLLPEEKEWKYTIEGGFVKFTLPKLDTFHMFALQYDE